MTQAQWFILFFFTLAIFTPILVVVIGEDNEDSASDSSALNVALAPQTQIMAQQFMGDTQNKYIMNVPAQLVTPTLINDLLFDGPSAPAFIHSLNADPGSVILDIKDDSLDSLSFSTQFNKATQGDAYILDLYKNSTKPQANTWNTFCASYYTQEKIEKSYTFIFDVNITTLSGAIRGTAHNQLYLTVLGAPNCDGFIQWKFATDFTTDCQDENPFQCNVDLSLPSALDTIAPQSICAPATFSYVHPRDCQAWTDLFDATAGHNWTSCATKRTDPCSCDLVSCAFDALTHTTRLNDLQLANNHLNGTLPRTLAYLPTTATLNVSYNTLQSSNDCTPPPNGVPLLDNQCKAWKDFYDHTGGPFWTHCALHRLDPCACNTPDSYVTCSEQIHDGATVYYTAINAMDFNANNLSGTLPTSFAHFRHLNYIDLSVNNLSGPLPSFSMAENVDDCLLIDYQDATEQNLFDCPIPDNIVSHCYKVSSTGTETSIATTDCHSSTHT